MDYSLVPQHKAAQDNVRTEQLPAQERLSLDAQELPQLSAEQVYAQRLNETLPDGNLSAPTFIP